MYADGLIQWTTGDASDGEDGFGGTAALVGYNAGDGIISFSVPGSYTHDILNMPSTSNVRTPGMWVFRLDKDDIVFSLCDDNPSGI